MGYNNKIIGDKECPSCRSIGRDKTGNHLILFSDGSAYCNRCEYREPSNTNSLPSNKYSDKDYKELFRTILTCPIYPLPSRSISKSTCEFYKVKTGLSEENGNSPKYIYFPRYNNNILIGYKCRVISEKRFWNIQSCPRIEEEDKSNPRTTELFGINQIPQFGNKIFITEGEIDAMSLYQTLKELSSPQYAHLEPAVVSLPDGAMSLSKSLTTPLAKKVLDKYKEIILVLDNDEEGRKAVREACKILDNSKVRIATLPLKDANEMVKAGRKEELKWAVLTESKPYVPTSIISVEDIWEEALKKPEWGYSWPWPTLTQLTYGIRRGEVYGFAAAPKIGKSEAMKQIQEHLIVEHDLSVALFMLEEKPSITAKALAGKFMGKPFHKPDVEFNEEELKEGLEKIKYKVKFLDHYGFKDWEDIKQNIRYLVAVEDIKDIFIDPLTALTSKVSASEANDLLNIVMTDVTSMAQELDFTCYYTSHLNPPKTGTPHERGGKVHESQLTGSRAMIKWSQYIIGIERNKDPEIPEKDRNTSNMILLADRNFGNVGQFPIYYDKDTSNYLEMVSHPFSYKDKANSIEF